MRTNKLLNLKKMHSTLKKWTQELANEIEIVSSNEINEEARANMVSFGFKHDQLKEWGKSSVCEFISACADLYRQKASQLDMVFYSWFDEQAGQIRVSAVSQFHNKLPFGCKLNSTNLNQVVNGVFSGESGLYTKGALEIWCEII